MIYVDNIKVKSFKFPGGELQVIIPPLNRDRGYMKVTAVLKSSDDILELLLTMDALRRTCGPLIKYSLEIPYFPYARQDRVCNGGEALSLKVMADLINSLGCCHVTVTDPHSDVLVALLHNCLVTHQHTLIPTELDLDVIVSPDAGATKKAEKAARTLGLGIVYGRKERDTKTGEIKSTRLDGEVLGLNCLIVDDICDGGRTFIELAKVLKDKGSDNLYLYITHGIFSKGIEPLKPYFKKIYCYHTWLTDYDPEYLIVEKRYE